MFELGCCQKVIVAIEYSCQASIADQKDVDGIGVGYMLELFGSVGAK